jgi:glycosyltransferase involved in cell wall biosynthesis
MSRKLKAPWVAAFYLFAPNPFRGFTKEFQIPSLKNIFYFLSQKFIYWLIKKFADLVFVTYDLDRIPFIKQGIPQEKVKAIYGGVDIETIGKVKPSAKNRYTACFVGRFHPQKGLKELVSIWKLVCQQKKTAQLALIGTGEKETVAWLKQQFKKKNLSKNVSFFGFLDGIEKYKILKSSKVYLCSNLYDSGGMATIEAMACGLPVVSFDIPQIRSLIPKGTLRVPFRDTEVFAREILRVLEDNKLSAKISKEGLSLAKDWDWGKRAERILNFCKAITKEEK